MREKNMRGKKNTLVAQGKASFTLAGKDFIVITFEQE